MTTISHTMNLDRVEWRRVYDNVSNDYIVDFEYSLLGYDIESGRLDMMLRYAKGGHCRPHRHIACTTTLVIEGDQFVQDVAADGTKSPVVHRTKGAYAVSAADADLHDEWGGENGATILLSLNAPDSQGVLFEYCDKTRTRTWQLSLQEYVDDWKNGKIHGGVPEHQSSLRA